MANKQIAQCEKAGFGSLPICIAKSQYSFSCDPAAKGVPTGFRITVREIRSCVGAGFLYPICGDIMTVSFGVVPSAAEHLLLLVSPR
jgi:formate--tetrahydrofolate ligase